MVSDSVLGTIFAVGAHCAALVIAFHVASSIEISSVEVLRHPHPAPSATTSAVYQWRTTRSPLIGTLLGPPTNRSSSSTSPVPTISNGVDAEICPNCCPLTHNNNNNALQMQTSNITPPPHQSSFSAMPRAQSLSLRWILLNWPRSNNNNSYRPIRYNPLAQVLHLKLSVMKN